MSHQLVFDLRKCSMAWFWWENQTGIKRAHKPHHQSVNGSEVLQSAFAWPHPDYPCETELERARRLDLLDVWQPVVRFQVHYGHTITFHGDKAKALWKAWGAHIFGKKKDK